MTTEKNGVMDGIGDDLEGARLATHVRHKEIESALSELRKMPASQERDKQRAELTAELAMVVERHRLIKERIKEDNTQRNFAGLMSPFHDVCADQLEPELLQRLEYAAMVKQRERSRIGAERAAARAAKAPEALLAAEKVKEQKAKEALKAEKRPLRQWTEPAPRSPAAMRYEDISLVCRECQSPFMFEAAQQAFFDSRGFTQPVRCPSCRADRKRAAEEPR